MITKTKSMWMYQINPESDFYFIYGEERIKASAENLMRMLEENGPTEGPWLVRNNISKVREGDPILVKANSKKRGAKTGLVAIGHISKVDRGGLTITSIFDMDRTRILMAKPIPSNLFWGLNNNLKSIRSNLGDISTYQEQIFNLISYLEPEEHAQKPPDDNEKDIIDSEFTLDKEGRRKYRVHVTIERSRTNRKRVLSSREKPYKCQVCGLDYATAYGPNYGDFIQVHHIKPIASYSEQKPTLDDFAVLCANCHAIAHWKNPTEPLSINELKTLWNDHGSNKIK